MALGKTNINTHNKIIFSSGYGDGSLNTLACGWEGHLAINGVLAYADTTGYIDGLNTNFRTGADVASDASIHTNISNTPFRAVFNSSSLDWIPTKDKVTRINEIDNQYNGSGYSQYHDSGTVTASFTTSFTGEKTCRFSIHASNLTGTQGISGLKFCVDDNYYTLEEMVNKSIIKPIVIIDSTRSMSSHYTYTFTNALNLYNGGDTGNDSWPQLWIWFMTNSGYTFSGVQFTAYAYARKGDGWQMVITDTENFHMTYVE